MGTGDAPAPAVVWALRKSGLFFVATGVMLVVVFALSAPAVLITPAVVPNAEPFVWLALLGLSITLSSPTLTEREADWVDTLTDDIDTLPGSAKVAYLLGIAFMLVSGLSVLVGGVGLVGAVATETPLTAVAAIPFALFYPRFDVFLSRTVGWNLASTGAVLGLVPLFLFDKLSTDPDVSRNAFRRLRVLTGG